MMIKPQSPTALTNSTNAPFAEFSSIVVPLYPPPRVCFLESPLPTACTQAPSQTLLWESPLRKLLISIVCYDFH